MAGRDVILQQESPLQLQKKLGGGLLGQNFHNHQIKVIKQMKGTAVVRDPTLLVIVKENPSFISGARVCCRAIVRTIMEDVLYQQNESVLRGTGMGVFYYQLKNQMASWTLSTVQSISCTGVGLNFIPLVRLRLRGGCGAKPCDL